MLKSTLALCFLVVVGTAIGCSSAAKHHQALPSTQEQEMTVGVVQKEIRVGMSQTDVAVALGSPNIVTRDSVGKEAWVYDKMAREVSYSQDGGGVWLIFTGYGKRAVAASSTQKTLTVVIKFDEKSLVESFSYHASKF